MKLYSFTHIEHDQPRDYYARCDVERLTRLLELTLYPQSPPTGDLGKLMQRVRDDERDLEAQL